MINKNSALQVKLISNTVPNTIWGISLGALLGNHYYEKNRKLGAILGGLFGGTAVGASSALNNYMENMFFDKRFRESSKKEASLKNNNILNNKKVY